MMASLLSRSQTQRRSNHLWWITCYDTGLLYIKIGYLVVERFIGGGEVGDYLVGSAGKYSLIRLVTAIFHFKGSSMRNSLPPSGNILTPIEPPSISTLPLTVYSPIPLFLPDTSSFL